MKLTHTHRGHCQLCGAVQALDPETSHIAKHGYTVPDGYFVGTCPGSDHPNLHVERNLADASVQRARERAIRMEVTARDYELREDHPTHVWNGVMRLCKPWGTPKPSTSYDWNRLHGSDYIRLREEPVKVEWAEASPEWQEKGRNAAIVDLRQAAQRDLNYADHLEGEANRVHLKVEPYKVTDLALRGFKVGDTVHIGGAKGFDTVIEAIEDKEYRASRWSRKASKIPHAQITSPARPERRSKSSGYMMEPARPAATYWVPIRFLKKPGASK